MKLYLMFSILLTINLSARRITNGNKLYNSVCFACHGKDLEGATGPKLTDYQWLHGDSKEQIMTSIKNGFPEKGMVGFGSMFNDNQISELADFILSRQHGLQSMEYKVYHGVTVGSGVDWTSQKPDKFREMSFPRVNLNLPEVDQFGLSFKGDFIIAEHLSGDYMLKGLIRQQEGFEIFIDKKKLNVKFTDKSRFEAPVKLRKGLHEFEFRYIRNFKDGTLLLDLIGKGNIPISGQSIQKSMTSSHIVKARDSFTIMRKRVLELPPGAVVVNHQDKISYAINPRDASISAIWLGDSLDLGPNIYARGQNAAKLLGKQLFNLVKSIELMIEGHQHQLKFIGYSTKRKPRFMYRYGKHQINVESSMTAQGLILKYYSVSMNGPSMQLTLPAELQVNGFKGTRHGEFLFPDDSNALQIIIPVEQGEQ